jgi:hypothetical protein
MELTGAHDELMHLRLAPLRRRHEPGHELHLRPTQRHVEQELVHLPRNNHETRTKSATSTDCE